ncbi:hypothetical protein K493DRAFT_341951 [Basidiobolus meristosporus CBS 931.73]|uniref:Extracellular membrane protein CFEM domain-containing protein n=1 Tax=Basidiobolus meristosporus CBS 931.73 TaxID=1314790 RepID=A0A1Y1XEB7_9FUNG|nr:hypothetical protein K493DRAFT_341951 [Basidiobolus meristosporus CBS 931.73]|eukprot:ORX84057.1 hypothetical protein K493DRAFT_341951 [Basidiobolus meristosporus CBS 931.73]
MKFNTTVATLAFIAISANQALAQQSPCEAKCAPEDMICRAKCFNVPAPQVSDINATQECVSKCVDPATAAKCFQDCIGSNWGELLPTEPPAESSAAPSSKPTDAKPSSANPSQTNGGSSAKPTSAATQASSAASQASSVASSAATQASSAASSVASQLSSAVSSSVARPSASPATPSAGQTPAPTSGASSVVLSAGLLSAAGVIALALF